MTNVIEFPHRNKCVHCEKPIFGEPERSIHRDGIGYGPELPLCLDCGGEELPTCEQIWAKISRVPQALRDLQECYDSTSQTDVRAELHDKLVASRDFINAVLGDKE